MAREWDDATVKVTTDAFVSVLDELIPTGATRGELDRGGRKLRWVEAGSGSPTVVFESGAGTAAVNWTAIMAALAGQARVIAYDRAGFGQSDRAVPLTLDIQVGDLAALLAEVGDGPCVVVGHSWGAMLAEMVAWTEPGLIAGLVLVDPGDERYLATMPRRAHLVMAARRRFWVAVSALGLLKATLRKECADDARKVSQDPRIQSLLAKAWETYYATQEQIRTLLLDERRVIAGNLGEIARRRARAQWPDVPVTVLTAAQSMPTAEECARLAQFHAETAAAVPGARHLVIPDSGHFIHYDQPAAVVEAVFEVLAAARPSPTAPSRPTYHPAPE